MVFGEETVKVVKQSLEERALSASRHHTDGNASILYLLHKRKDTGEDFSHRHTMENLRLDVIHALRLLRRYLLALLHADIMADGVDAACSFRGIRVVGSEVDAELAHRLLPCHSMIGHGVIEHSVHVEEHHTRSKLRE